MAERPDVSVAAGLDPGPGRPQDRHDPGGKVRLLVRDADVVSRARFSACGRYRYELERRWDGRAFGEGGLCGFLMMNPSTADEHVDDPTVRRCRDFARRWGHGGLVVLNAFAFRATEPGMLLSTPDPVGPENDATIADWAVRLDRVVVAWGLPPKRLRWRSAQLEALLSKAGVTPVALKTTACGQPGHPLYIRGDTEPKPWPPAPVAAGPVA